MKNISIIGAGSWGVALAKLLSENGHSVKVWSCFKDEVDMLNSKREHISKLPDIKIPSDILFTTDLSECLESHELVVLVVPSEFIRKSAREINKYMNSKSIIVICSKGLEQETGLRLSEVVMEECNEAKVVVLYGPSHAEEVAKSVPTTVVSASGDRVSAEIVQDAFMCPNFRVYTNSDIIGVEIGAAIKNGIALCAGICDGLGFGDNSKAALMTRGLTEIARLGIKMGANTHTFAGLTGIGDLIVTCTSMHSRNRRAGILIGKGMSVEEALKEVKMVVEGVPATKAAYHLMNKHDVDMPITTEAYKILFENKDCKKAVYDLMTRSKKHETEDSGW